MCVCVCVCVFVCAYHNCKLNHNVPIVYRSKFSVLLVVGGLHASALYVEHFVDTIISTDGSINWKPDMVKTLGYTTLLTFLLLFFVCNSCKTLIGVHEMHGPMHPN